MSARDFMGQGGLTSNAYTEVEDADPRVGLVNLADVMLVFACGLMLALVTYWNLDISAMTEVMEADAMSEVSGIEDLEDQMGDGSDASFTQLGMVYQDPMTGKMYMLKEDVAEEGAEGAGEQGSQGGQPSGEQSGTQEGGQNGNGE